MFHLCCWYWVELSDSSESHGSRWWKQGFKTEISLAEVPAGRHPVLCITKSWTTLYYTIVCWHISEIIPLGTFFLVNLPKAKSNYALWNKATLIAAFDNFRNLLEQASHVHICATKYGFVVNTLQHFTRPCSLHIFITLQECPHPIWPPDCLIKYCRYTSANSMLTQHFAVCMCVCVCVGEGGSVSDK